jgi:hypothetical protein
MRVIRGVPCWAVEAAGRRRETRDDDWMAASLGAFDEG